VEGERQAVEIDLEVDLGREAAARAAERLVVLPPLAPAAETCARTTMAANICTRCAVRLISASASKKASNTPARLRRQKRFQTEFQCPYLAGSARQVMVWCMKWCSASRNRRSLRPLAPQREREARNTSSTIAQSSPVIRVSIEQPPRRGRDAHNNMVNKSSICPHGLDSKGYQDRFKELGGSAVPTSKVSSGSQSLIDS
jgi:hypothetical protein